MNKERNEMLAELQLFLDSTIVNASPVVLEAGCGSRSHVRLPKNSFVVGIDISKAQLDRNDSVSEKIEGDIQSYRLDRERFDVIVCWDVLEHVRDPERAVRNFVNALKPGAIAILAFPNVSSLWGLVTKYSPHWFHVFYYRYVLGNARAGIDDNGPFRTYLAWKLNLDNFKKIAKEQNCSVVFERLYDPMLHSLIKRSKLLGGAYKTVARALHIVSLGRLGGIGNSGITLVYKKNTQL